MIFKKLRRFGLPSLPLVCWILFSATCGHAGSISGFITDEVSGQPVSGLDLNLYDAGWNYVHIDATSDSGYYTFYNVTAGSYYVKANPKWDFHYRAEYWADSFSRAGAIPVPVADGQDVTGIDFQLTVGYYIGGKILDAGGLGLDGIDLNVYDPDWVKMDVDAGSETGRYYVGALPEGQYYVMANPIYAQPYVDQYWDHSNGPVNATLVTITAPDDTFGIDFDLADGSYITGTVKDSVTQAPVPDISMKAYNSSGQKMRISARTKSDGTYVLGAYPSGDYTILADPTYPDGYMDMFYASAFQTSDAQPVTISPPKPSDGIDFALPAGSYIRGNVTDMQANPLADIKMKFYGSDWLFYEFATCLTKSSGDYLSGALKPGMYYVKAVPVYPQPYIDEYYDDAVSGGDATAVEIILDAETTGIDFALEKGGYLLGTVTDQLSGNAVYSVDMDLYDGQWSFLDYSDHTDTRGEFTIGALPFGGYYLHCNPYLSQGYIPEFYDDVFWQQNAVLIHLTDTADVFGLDFALIQGGKITGRITDQIQGIPVPDVTVEVYSPQWNLLPLRPEQSKSDGMYTAFGMPTGNYYVKAVPLPASGYYEEYYSEASSPSGAIVVNVAEGATTAGINFTLMPGKPTPTPAVSFGVQLEIPAEMFYPGDLFYLNARLSNPGQSMGSLPLFVILDVYGQLFFWPSWTLYKPPYHTDIDYSMIEFVSGVQIIPILQAFNWPDIQGPDVTGLIFYGALVTEDFSALVGEMDVVTFGYGSP
ncbi:carboxypeptidase regulatory-like domain-containing protein [bacterium]|nr:carboxypeptidase regulatory-like domain-containing protein [candidate division CSSED10-310 bacterium]